MREIEEKTGFAKSSIRETLAARGLPLRNASKRQPVNRKSAVKMRSPVIPYGHAWLEGKLVVEPREYKVVLKIMQLWQSGKTQAAIAGYLNAQKVPTRMGKKWFHSTVGAVIKRQNEENKKP